MTKNEFNNVMMDFERLMFTAETFEDASNGMMLLQIFLMSNELDVGQMRQAEALLNAFDKKLSFLEDED